MLSLLRTAINPARFGYFKQVLEQKVNFDPKGRALLDVGCGGGFLSEEFARLGFSVTGVDPSEKTLQSAAAHAQQVGLQIQYQKGTGEKIPCPDNHFDVVTCCDVLEHVSDLGTVIREITRVLKPGGVFFYDTINRSPLSWLVMIKLFQDWKTTAILPKNLHVYQMFIKPSELVQQMSAAGLLSQHMAGMEPKINPLQLLRLLVQKNKGQVSFKELGERAQFKVTNHKLIGYMGYAIKP